MTSIDFGNETRLQEWSRREFDLTYSQFCALVALVAAHRIGGGESVIQREAVALLWTFEDREGKHVFVQLERLGLAVRAKNAGETGLEKTWHPTPRGINRVLPPLVAALPVLQVLEESGPGLAKAPRERVEEQRAAG